MRTLRQLGKWVIHSEASEDIMLLHYVILTICITLKSHWPLHRIVSTVEMITFVSVDHSS